MKQKRGRAFYYLLLEMESVFKWLEYYKNDEICVETLMDQIEGIFKRIKEENNYKEFFYSQISEKDLLNQKERLLNFKIEDKDLEDCEIAYNFQRDLLENSHLRELHFMKKEIQRRKQ